tara:strand:+ start:704 stop:1804 length:1101 start_codon:yes stop_codon:yes gene_type:complete
MASNTSDFFTFSKTAGTAKNLQKPTDGGDNNLWGGFINVDLDTIVGAVNATSDLIADANQNELVDFTATGSAVNHVGITNAATGNGPTIEAAGDDTNIDLNVSGKGTGALTSTGAKLTSPKVITGVNDTNGNELVKVTATGSAVNEFTVVNAATGNPPEIQATGDDTNIHLKLTPKGTGGVSVGDILHAFLPVGMISPFGITTVPAGWLYCNGATLGNAASGATNASDDYEALYDLIKTLWGNSGGTFSAGNTINLPNLQAAFLRGIDANTGHQMANGNNFSGPTSVGSFENDSFQGHRHEYKITTDNASVSPAHINVDKANSGLNGTAIINGRVFDPITDGSNGTPRTGDETRPFNAGVKYCIKF